MADNYIIIRGGLVQNDPTLEVFDLDVLDTDFVDDAAITEVVDLRKRARTAGLDTIVDECTEWIAFQNMVAEMKKQQLIKKVSETP